MALSNKFWKLTKEICVKQSVLASSNWSWKMPVGYDTGVTIYNSITEKNVPLILNNERLATWYTCGPTVYDEAHIGHASCYVRFDIMRRVLESFFNVDVVLLMGITDIDDKIINRAREMNLSMSHLTSHYEQDFYQDMAMLRVNAPTIITRVTDHIPQIITFCQTLLNNGSAYVSSTGTMYFDTNKLGNYGKLVHVNSLDDNLESVIEEAESEKKNPKDFALWKAAKPGEPWWQAPWGKGRPGWHIECSAMASHIFGKDLDIHSGGMDLKFPHHENEESQCVAYHGKNQWSNYWIHAGHLHMQNDTKMSKSLKNTISVKEFLKENSVNDFRLFCLMKPYRSSIEYSNESMSNAKGMVTKFKSFLDDCESYVDGNLVGTNINDAEILACLNSTRVKIKEALKNDFNTSQSLDALTDLVTAVNRGLVKTSRPELTLPRSAGVVAACSSYVSKILGLLGVEFPVKKASLNSSDVHVNALPQVMNSIVEFRRQVRLYALTTGPLAQPQINTLEQDKVISDSSGILPELSKEPIKDKGTMEWTTIVPKQLTKVERKQRAPLLEACDVLRDKLLTVGIQIKDRGKESDWYLLENRSIEARKSSISCHDSFDPDYKPTNQNDQNPKVSKIDK